MTRRLTEQDARNALARHVLQKASQARGKYGNRIDAKTFARILEDREVVRYPTRIRFCADRLEPGHFAATVRAGADASTGYVIEVHPSLEGRSDLLPLVIAYHLVRVNYGALASPGDAEQFGAALLGMDVKEYYQALCEIADSLGDSQSASCPKGV